MTNELTLGALLGIVVVGVAATQGAAAPPDGCFGKPATITGSGLIDGTSSNDVIVGSAADDTIDGRGGNDLICGGAGSDELVGGWATTGSAPGTATILLSATSTRRAATFSAAVMIGC